MRFSDTKMSVHFTHPYRISNVQAETLVYVKIQVHHMLARDSALI